MKKRKIDEEKRESNEEEERIVRRKKIDTRNRINNPFDKAEDDKYVRATKFKCQTSSSLNLTSEINNINGNGTNNISKINETVNNQIKDANNLNTKQNIKAAQFRGVNSISLKLSNIGRLFLLATAIMFFYLVFSMPFAKATPALCFGAAFILGGQKKAKVCNDPKNDPKKKISRKECVKLFDISPTTAFRYFKVLERKGLSKRKGVEKMSIMY